MSFQANAYKLYLFTVGMRRLGFNTSFTLIAVYLVRVVGTNPLELVLPGTAYEVMIFLFEIPTGVVADVYSRRLSVIIGYFLLGVGLLVAGSMPMFWVVVIGLGISGLGSTFVSGALAAWLVDEIGQEEATQAFVREAQIRQIFGLLGIVVSIVLGSINLQLAIVGGGVILLITAFILMLVMPETGFQGIPKSERESWRDLFKTFGEGARYVRAQHILLWILVVTFLFAGFEEAFGKMWQAHILATFTLPQLGQLDDVVWFGIIAGVFMPVTLFATEMIRRRVRLTDNNSVVRTLTWVFNAMIGSVLVFTLAESFGLALLGLWITQMLMAMARPLMDSWINQHIQSNVRATILSIHGQIHSFGEIGGGPFVGYIGMIATIRVALSLSVLILLPLIPVFNQTKVPAN